MFQKLTWEYSVPHTATHTMGNHSCFFVIALLLKWSISLKSRVLSKIYILNCS